MVAIFAYGRPAEAFCALSVGGWSQALAIQGARVLLFISRQVPEARPEKYRTAINR
jgi:hypothetical protein